MQLRAACIPANDLGSSLVISHVVGMTGAMGQDDWDSEAFGVGGRLCCALHRNQSYVTQLLHRSDWTPFMSCHTAALC